MSNFYTLSIDGLKWLIDCEMMPWFICLYHKQQGDTYKVIKKLLQHKFFNKKKLCF